MTLEEVIEYFGNLNQVVKAIGLAPQNTTSWKRKGYIPLLQQYRIAEVTDGSLVPDDVDPKMKVYKKGQKKA